MSRGSGTRASDRWQQWPANPQPNRVRVSEPPPWGRVGFPPQLPLLGNSIRPGASGLGEPDSQEPPTVGWGRVYSGLSLLGEIQRVAEMATQVAQTIAAMDVYSNLKPGESAHVIFSGTIWEKPLVVRTDVPSILPSGNSVTRMYIVGPLHEHQQVRPVRAIEPRPLKTWGGGQSIVP